MSQWSFRLGGTSDRPLKLKPDSTRSSTPKSHHSSHQSTSTVKPFAPSLCSNQNLCPSRLAELQWKSRGHGLVHPRRSEDRRFPWARHGLERGASGSSCSSPMGSSRFVSSCRSTAQLSGTSFPASLASSHTLRSYADVVKSRPSQLLSPHPLSAVGGGGGLAVGLVCFRSFSGPIPCGPPPIISLCWPIPIPP
jgi:hypothetical protein